LISATTTAQNTKLSAEIPFVSRTSVLYLQYCLGTATMLYQPYAGIAPSRDDNAYILALVPTIANGLAAITSANELFIVDRNLASAQSRSLDNAPNGTNCLVSGDFQGQTVLCSGTNGNVATFDVRSQREVSRIEIGRLRSRLCSSTGLIYSRPRCDRTRLQWTKHSYRHGVKEPASHR